MHWNLSSLASGAMAVCLTTVSLCSCSDSQPSEYLVVRVVDDATDREGLDIDTLRRELVERWAISEAFTDKLIEGLKKAGSVPGLD